MTVRSRSERRRWVRTCARIAATLTAACAVKTEGALVGSAPTILDRLSASWMAAYSSDRARVVLPLGPPQGKLSPTLEGFLEGKLDFAFLTRELATSDLTTFRRHYGRDPLVLPVAGGAWHSFGFVDPVVFIVNRANPIPALSFRQLDGLFSTSRLRGSAPIQDWAELGLPAWRGRAVHVAGGEAWKGEETARAQTVKRIILSYGGTPGRWKTMPNSGSEADVVARVAADPLAIGFTGLGHIDRRVRTVALSSAEGSKPVSPNRRAILSARYPLVRTVDLLLPTDPDGCPAPDGMDLAAFLLSPQGQAVISRTQPFVRLAPRQLESSRQAIAACHVGK